MAMRNVTEPTDARRQYSAAYTAHYAAGDLSLALRLYKAILDGHPTMPEAEYSRMQIRNIVNVAVPPVELLDVEIDLARRCLQPT
jgi:hypothetical protein